MEGGGQGNAQSALNAKAQGAHNARTPHNETPVILVSSFDTIVSIIESYGWVLLISVFAIMYFYQKYKPSYEKWKQKQENFREAEVRKTDPDRSYAVQLSMEEARHNLQERVSVDAEAKRIREKEIAEQKRLEKIEEWEKHKQGKGYHSKKKGTQEEESALDKRMREKEKKRKNDFRAAYNPLDYAGGSSRYRPSGSGGGG